jgi:hypothetical protein
MNRRRRRLFAVLAGLAALLAAHAALWFATASRLRSGFEDWAAAERAQGWSVSAGTPRRAGWPLAVAIDIPAPRIAGSFGIPGGLAWSAGTLTLAIVLRHPTELTLIAAGPQTLQIGPMPAVPYTADRLEAAVALTLQGPPSQADITIAALQAQLPDGELAVAETRLHLDSPPGDDRGLTLAATAVDLPPLGQIFGRRLDRLDLDIRLAGTAPPLPDPAAWRDSGGSLIVRRLALRWGRLQLDASATIALDASLQPAGTANARLVDPVATVDALAAAHAIPPGTARAARAVLSLLARVPAGGGPPEVEAPLTLQNRNLAFAGFPLLVLPEIVWPKPR